VNEGITDLEYIEYRYKQLRSERHPDKGGSDDLMAELQRAIEQAREALK